MLVTEEERQTILTLIKEIQHTDEIPPESLEYINKNWIEFLLISLTEDNGRHINTLDRIIKELGGGLSIEHDTYEELIKRTEGTAAYDYLTSIWDDEAE